MSNRYEKPTPIQMQTLPVALSGRDVVGLAKTGSGKTAAYLLPLCVHVIAQPALKRGEGPIAIVLAPTRELSEQIHRQARIFAKPYNISVAACFGGLRKYDQVKALKAGSDVVIATPGRMIDLLKVFQKPRFGKRIRNRQNRVRCEKRRSLFWTKRIECSKWDWKNKYASENVEETMGF